MKIGGIDFVIKQTDDAFDVEIPEINAIYTHMLGHDCHSIVAGADHADAMIAELRNYIEKGYDLILTSHYTPEDLKDAQTKIDYLETLKKIAAGVQNADEFKAEIGKEYPQYSGQELPRYDWQDSFLLKIASIGIRRKSEMITGEPETLFNSSLNERTGG